MRAGPSERGSQLLAASTLLLGVGLQLLACGGGGSGGSSISGGSSLSVSPANASVEAGKTQQFQAIGGPAGVSAAVTWSASSGTISNTGMYTAPANVPNPSTVTVTATSTTDTAQSGSARVGIFLVHGVTVSPGSATLQPGQNQQFTAAVQGEGTFDTTVTWQVNQAPGGYPQVGTITADGSYTAPTGVPNPDPVTVQAVSNADQGVSGNVSVGVVGITSVAINPTSVSLFPGQSQQFTATVQGIGTFDPTVVWSVQGSAGTVTQQGLYQLPAGLAQATQETVTVTAANNSTASTYANVFEFANPSIISLSPNQGGVGDSLTITGQNLDTGILVTFTGPNGVPITTQGWGASTTAAVLVPHDAVSGSITLQETAGGRVSAVSNSLQFTRIPSLRIRAESTNLSPGETTTMHAEVLGENHGQAINWSTDLGSISAAGVYMAPGSVAADSYSHVSGCITATQVCDSLIIGVRPFQVQPQNPVVSLGNSLPFLTEVGGSPVGATWKLTTGGGSLSGSGVYTAGGTVADGGLAVVSATYAGNTETASVAVTGGFPGMTNYLFDYVDNRQQPGKATSFLTPVAVSGNRLFVLANPIVAIYLYQTEYFIDQYDITNPANPTWVSSTEAFGPGVTFVQGNYLYEVGIDTLKYPEPMSVVATFDISEREPLLVGRTLVPQMNVESVTPGFAYASPGGFNQPPIPENTALMYQLDLRSGIPVIRELLLPYPIPGYQPIFQWTTGNGNRLFMSVLMASISSGDNQWLLAQYDLTQDPPILMSSMQAPLVTQPALLGNTLVVGGTVYDVSGTQPTVIATVQNLQTPAVDTLGNLLLAENGSGVSVIDLTTPRQPKVLNQLSSDTDSLSTARFAGPDRIITTGYPSNLSFYDVSESGGPFQLAALTEPLLAGGVLDQQATSSNLFAAIVSGDSSFVAIFDATASPVQPITRIDMGTANALAVQALNNVLYVGTDQGLSVYDISNISSPQKVGSINQPAVTLAITGKILFAETTNNQLLAYDISNATVPNLIFSGTLAAPANFFRVSGNLLFVPDTTAGLLIYDVSQPAAPLLLAQWNPAVSVVDVAVSGSQAFLATDAGLIVADISKPAQPVKVGQGMFPASFQQSQDAFGSTVMLQDGIAYVGTANSGAMLFGFDVRNTASPRLVSMSAYGSEADAAVLSLALTPSQLNVGGFFSGVYQPPLVPMDLTQPRNIILTSQGQPAALAAAAKSPRSSFRPDWVKSDRASKLGRGQSKLRMLQLRKVER